MNEERGHATPAEGAPEALAEAEVQEEFAEMEVDAPRVRQRATPRREARVAGMC